jgi:hypothetical protein
MNVLGYSEVMDWASLQLDLKNFMCNFGLDINPKRSAIELRGRIFPERPGGHRKIEFPGANPAYFSIWVRLSYD